MTVRNLYYGKIIDIIQDANSMKFTAADHYAIKNNVVYNNFYLLVISSYHTVLDENLTTSDFSVRWRQENILDIYHEQLMEILVYLLVSISSSRRQENIQDTTTSTGRGHKLYDQDINREQRSSLEQKLGCGGGGTLLHLLQPVGSGGTLQRWQLRRCANPNRDWGEN
jgi:hypothetical protein